mgnify:CR=1 FL=1
MDRLNYPKTLEDRMAIPFVDASPSAHPREPAKPLPPVLAERAEALIAKPTHPLFLAKKDVEKIAEAIAGPDRQTQFPLPANREKFCQIVAFSGVRKNEAYALSHGIEIFDPKIESAELCREQMKCLSDDASALMANTTVRLRIAELRKPVVRKLQKKFEYDLQKALAQANISWELAYDNGDVPGMLAAVTLQSKLSRLMVEEVSVTHRYGLLDNTTTETLLAIRAEVEKRKDRQKRLQTSVTVDSTPVKD